MDLATRLEVFSELLDCANVALWHFDGEMRLISTNAAQQELFMALLAVGGGKQSMLRYCLENHVPGFGADAASLLWVAAPQHVNGVLTDIYIVGPVFGSATSEAAIVEALGNLRLGSELIGPTGEMLRNVPVIQNTMLMQYGIMLHKCLTGEKLAPSDLQLIVVYDTPKRLSAAEELECKAADYALEQQIFQAVEDGNIHYSHPAAVYQIKTGTLCRNDPLRHAKNELVSCLTLLTRAAIRGGMPAGSAYALADYYIQQSEDSRNIAEVYQSIQDAFKDYTERVHKYKLAQGRSREIQECISYLELHLNQRVSLDHLSESLGYSKNYLSGKFSREVGVSITEYATQLKIERAKVWLQSTDKPIQSISDDLGFNSVSYFSAQFRKLTGQTPSDYRNRRGTT